MKAINRGLIRTTAFFDACFLAIILLGGPGLMVQSKLAIFSNTIGRTEEVILNEIISSLFKHGEDYATVLSAEERKTLYKIKQLSGRENCIYLKKASLINKPTAQDCIVYGVISELIPGSGGATCGNSGDLESRLKATKNNVGCCSDFAESFLVYAGSLGVKAREVHDGLHTTAEYYDPMQSKWKWIDPQYNQQIASDGVILSANEIIASEFTKKLDLVDFADSGHFSPYLRISNKNLLGYTLGNNILEVDRFEAFMIGLHLPKSVIQLVSHVAGVRPSYLWVRSGADAYLQRLYKYVSIAIFMVLVSLNLIAILSAFGQKTFPKR